MNFNTLLYKHIYQISCCYLIFCVRFRPYVQRLRTGGHVKNHYFSFRQTWRPLRTEDNIVCDYETYHLLCGLGNNHNVLRHLYSEFVYHLFELWTCINDWLMQSFRLLTTHGLEVDTNTGAEGCARTIIACVWHFRYYRPTFRLRSVQCGQTVWTICFVK